MGRNTGNGTRIGITPNRYQAFNPKTKQYVKFDAKTKKIMSNSSKPYKNIRFKGKNPNIMKSEKIKIENTKKIKIIKSKKTNITKSKKTKFIVKNNGATKISKRGKKIKK